MPASSPFNGSQLKKILRHLGQQIHTRRKGLKISAVTTAEAAGISRMTLNRIEHGEASVTMGAYLNVISVLGLELELLDSTLHKKLKPVPAAKLTNKISISDYPQLKRLAWQLKSQKELSLQEALDLYERNWRHVDLNKMNSQERELIQALLTTFGRRRILV